MNVALEIVIGTENVYLYSAREVYVACNMLAWT